MDFDDFDTAPVFAISVVAQLTGMHPQTLRQYDRVGLVTPQRTSGGGRRYSARDVERLREIQHLSGEGIGLTGVKRILDLETARRRAADSACASSRPSSTPPTAPWRSCSEHAPPAPTSRCATAPPSSSGAAPAIVPLATTPQEHLMDFTTRSREALAAAQQSAVSGGNPQLEPVHLLAALLDEADGIPAAAAAGHWRRPRRRRSEGGRRGRPAAPGRRRRPRPGRRRPARCSACSPARKSGRKSAATATSAPSTCCSRSPACRATPLTCSRRRRD